MQNMISIKEDTNSMPGSLIETSGEPVVHDTSPVVCADDGFRSQQSDGLEEVNVELVEE